jgi:hypothetical protein
MSKCLILGAAAAIFLGLALDTVSRPSAASASSAVTIAPYIRG